MSYGKRRARRREGAGAKAPECAIAARRWVRRQTRCLVSVLTKRAINSMKTGQFILNSQIYAQRVPPRIACEQALIFGRVKRVSRERASERRSREARFACLNRRACSQATPRIHRCAGILEMPGSQAHRERLRVTAPSVNRFRLEKQQLQKVHYSLLKIS